MDEPKDAGKIEISGWRVKILREKDEYIDQYSVTAQRYNQFWFCHKLVETSEKHYCSVGQTFLSVVFLYNFNFLTGKSQSDGFAKCLSYQFFRCLNYSVMR